MNTSTLTDTMSYLNTKEMLTIVEASAYTGISESTLHKYCSDKKIPFSKPAGRWVFFKRTDLIEWMASRRVESSAGMRMEALKFKAS